MSSCFYCGRWFATLGLCLVVVLTGCVSAPSELPSGRAAILVRAFTDGDSGVQQLVFDAANGADSFLVNVDRRAKIKIVRPGEYYLSNLRVRDVGVLPGFDQPKDERVLIEVRANSVNYIGDVHVSEISNGDGVIYDYRIEINDRTKERALEIFPWISDYPLRANNPAGRSRPMLLDGAVGPGASRSDSAAPSLEDQERGEVRD